MTTLLADRLSHELDAVCRTEGVTEQQYRVLWVLCLSSEPDGLPLGSIADDLITRAPDVSRLVDRLEQADLVIRRGSAADRRIVLVAPTSRGVEVFERVTASIKELHDEQWHSLSDDDLQRMLGLLNRSFWRIEATEDDA
jgi:DNA-binding MarR family transcriptional regulator